jgi:Cu+-exporting ATPase
VVKKTNLKRDTLLLKIAVAGFCFGNAMLFSFPFSFGLGKAEQQFGHFSSLMGLLFCLAAVFYSRSMYFKQVYLNLKKGIFNIVLPLALGISILFIRTLTDFIFHTEEGFADSLIGLVFFLLIGRYVQQKTYHHLSFTRDYRSFFPVAAQVLDQNSVEKPISLECLKKEDRIVVRNHKIISADAILLKDDALIDFSFVTGETLPERKTLGEIVYACVRQTLASIELEIIKPVLQSYLTQL